MDRLSAMQAFVLVVDSGFLSRHPDLEMEAVLGDRNVDLVQEGIDVALRMGRLADTPLTARRTATTRHDVIGTAAYFARAGEPQAPEELIAHESVIYDQPGGGTAWTFHRDGAELPGTLKGRLHVTAAEGVRAAVLADVGIAIASEWMFAPELAAGSVKAVLQDWNLPSMDLRAVYPTGWTAATKARTFITSVEEVMRQAAGAGSAL